MLTQLITPAYEQCDASEPGAQFIEGYYYKPKHGGSLEEILRPQHNQGLEDIEELEEQLEKTEKELQDLKDEISAIDPDLDHEALSEAIENLQMK